MSSVDVAPWFCSFCACRYTPQRRRGPEGAGSLCNSCGLRWGKNGDQRRRKRLAKARPVDRRLTVEFLLNREPDVEKSEVDRAARTVFGFVLARYLRRGGGAD